ncbi:peptidyl-prolyl cis-trans isomerase [Solimonas terrae]|uniref:peptidylprolyl isomerase n=1 Tax=Solimonas terrae TaxID=1396819 RepID=A0A6M2BN58_9GAMM|nr:peptidylprolyl isomerase [Solimonas terrae]NGY03824.1 peptidyl-prolyl cis-trans isomerase [Solimonas terrae]
MRKLLQALLAVAVVMLLLALAWWLGRCGVVGFAPAAPAMSATATPANDAELLFREALRRGYAMDDLIVRRELVQRMRDALLQEHPVPAADDATLAAWLAQHAERYQAPARYSFDAVYLSRGEHGTGLQAAAEHVATVLRANPEQYARLGDPFPRGSHLERLDVTQIEADFGYALAKAVVGLPRGQWQGPLASPLGLHFLRITDVEPARVLTLAEARPRLRVDYRQAQQQQVLREALARLRRDFSGAPPLPQPAPLQDEEIP